MTQVETIIANHVAHFLEFALSRPDLTFKVTPIGCGLAGYQPRDIAWMFDLPPPSNVVLPPEFEAILFRPTKDQINDD